MIPNSFSAASDAISNNWCATSLCLEVHGRIVVLARRVEEDVGSGVDFGELARRRGALKPDYAIRQALDLLLRKPHEHDGEAGRIELRRKPHEVAESLALRPRRRHPEDHEAVPDSVPLAEVTRSRPEDGPVDGVVAHLDGVVPEEALADEARKPVRRRYQGHPIRRHARECPPLVGEVPRAVAPTERLRVGVELRASPRVRAMRLPLRALYICEVRAMAREGPAVVQRPPDPAAVSREPPEEHLDVDPVAVDIVQVHHVRVDLVEQRQQPRGVPLRMEAHAVVSADHGAVRQVSEPGRDAALMVAHGLVPPAPEDVGVHAPLGQGAVEAPHDGPRRPVVEAVQLDVAQRPTQPLRESERLVDEGVGRRGVVGARHSDFLHTILSTTPV